ncbi:hypothetical protein ETC02_01605 [Geobacillus sp. DSP4a]|nr:hypothetical protein [Geobacillus sp. DSP4a]
MSAVIFSNGSARTAKRSAAAFCWRSGSSCFFYKRRQAVFLQRKKADCLLFCASSPKSCACFFLNNTLFTLVRKNQHFLPILAQKTALLVKYVLR